MRGMFVPAFSGTVNASTIWGSIVRCTSPASVLQWWWVQGRYKELHKQHLPRTSRLPSFLPSILPPPPLEPLILLSPYVPTYLYPSYPWTVSFLPLFFCFFFIFSPFTDLLLRIHFTAPYGYSRAARAPVKQKLLTSPPLSLPFLQWIALDPSTSTSPPKASPYRGSSCGLRAASFRAPPPRTDCAADSRRHLHFHLSQRP